MEMPLLFKKFLKSFRALHELVIQSEEIKDFGGQDIVCLKQKRCYMESEHTECPRSHKAKPELASPWLLTDKMPSHSSKNALCAFHGSPAWDWHHTQTQQLQVEHRNGKHNRNSWDGQVSTATAQQSTLPNTSLMGSGMPQKHLR